jgi:hypothetical protein
MKKFAGARFPLNLTIPTHLICPGAMVLEGAFEGWIRGEFREPIRMRAGEAYSKIGTSASNLSRSLQQGTVPPVC